MPEIKWDTMNDYIVEDTDGNWYFCDEIGDPTGPYATKEIAHGKLQSYCKWLDTGEVEPCEIHQGFKL